MYNEEWKKKFVEQEVSTKQNGKESTSDNYLSMLRSLSPVEGKLGKDLSEFSTQEILDYYRSRSWASYEYIRVKNAMLLRYTDWCIENNLISSKINHYVEINDREILQSCLNLVLMKSKIILRDELLYDLEQIPNPSDKFIALGIYEGISSVQRSEFGHLYSSQFEGNILHLPTRDIIVSDELIQFGKESEKMYSSYPFLDGDPAIYDTSTLDNVYKEDDDSIIKLRVTSTSTSKKAYTTRVDLALDRMRKVFRNPVYSFMSLKNSGKVAYMKRFLETDNRCDSLTTILKYHSDEIINQYGGLNENYLKGIRSVFDK